MGNSAVVALQDLEDSRSRRSLFCAVLPSQNCLGHQPFDRGEFAIHKEVGIPRGRLSPEAMKYLSYNEVHLMYAAASPDVAGVRLYLARGASPDTYDENRTSPLHIACRQGSFAVVEELLAQRSSVNITDCAGWTALHIASYCGRADIVQLLLQRAADPTLINRRGETSWDLATDPESQRVFKRFYRDIEDEDTLIDRNKRSRDVSPIRSEDSYVPGPLNLSLLENSALADGHVPLTMQAKDKKRPLAVAD